MRRWLFLVLVVLDVGLLQAAPPYPPEPLPGALILAGGGEVTPELRDEFFRLAGGKERARLVIIPTASSQDEYLEADDPILADWAKLAPVSLRLLHTRERKTANDDAFVAPLTEATGVWFTNGHTDRLVNAYQGTRFEKELKALLERGGIVGGNDAGAAVLGDLVAQRFDPDVISPALGLLPGFVLSRRFGDAERAALARHAGYTGLGIGNETAVILRGRMIHVVGAGSATVFWSPSRTQPAHAEAVKAGAAFDLLQVRRAAALRAGPQPFPAATAAAPVVPKGALVIVGGGGATTDIMDRFFALAGGKDAPIVVVPTASEQEKLPDDPGDAKYLRKWGAGNLRVLHTRDRRRANDPDFSKVLLDAKGVWFGGGRQWRFIDSYEGTLTERRFRDVLERGGVIGGTSAGASIQSEYMPRGHPLGNRVMAAEGYERGFGFLPGCAVDQHFFARQRTADMTGLMKRYPQLLGIGIDEGTALVVQGHTAEVLGKSKAAFYDYRAGPPSGEADYVEVPAGGRYDLQARSVIGPLDSKGDQR